LKADRPETLSYGTLSQSLHKNRGSRERVERASRIEILRPKRGHQPYQRASERKVRLREKRRKEGEVKGIKKCRWNQDSAAGDRRRFTSAESPKIVEKRAASEAGRKEKEIEAQEILSQTLRFSQEMNKVGDCRTTKGGCSESITRGTTELGGPQYLEGR